MMGTQYLSMRRDFSSLELTLGGIHKSLPIEAIELFPAADQMSDFPDPRDNIIRSPCLAA